MQAIGHVIFELQPGASNRKGELLNYYGTCIIIYNDKKYPLTVHRSQHSPFYHGLMLSYSNSYLIES